MIASSLMTKANLAFSPAGAGENQLVCVFDVVFKVVYLVSYMWVVVKNCRERTNYKQKSPEGLFSKDMAQINLSFQLSYEQVCFEHI